jgi:hypothetical protein
MAMNKIKFLSEVTVDKDAAPEASGCIRNMWTGVLGQSTDKVKISEPMPYVMRVNSANGGGQNEYLSKGDQVIDLMYKEPDGDRPYKIYIYSIPGNVIGNKVTISSNRFYSIFDQLSQERNFVMPAIMEYDGVYTYPCNYNELTFISELEPGDYSLYDRSGTITLIWPDNVIVSHIIVNTASSDIAPSHATITYETTLNDVGDDGNVFIEYED